MENKFEEDYKSKVIFTASTQQYWNKLFPKDTLTFYGLNQQGNLVKLEDSYDKSRIDMVMLVEHNNKILKYAIELKERTLTSKCYGENNEGWLLEKKKYDEIIEYKQLSGMTPIYANLYTDGIIRIWNLNKTNTSNTINKPFNKYTVINSNKINKKGIQLYNKDGKTYGLYNQRTYS